MLRNAGVEQLYHDLLQKPKKTYGKGNQTLWTCHDLHPQLQENQSIESRVLVFFVAAIGEVAILHVLRLPILRPEVLFQLPGVVNVRCRWVATHIWDRYSFNSFVISYHSQALTNFSRQKNTTA